MKKIFLLFTYFCLIASTFSSIPAMDNDYITEASPLQAARQHSINADGDSNPTCKQTLWRTVSCCYRCPTCCEGCKDPTIIGRDSLGIDVYNSNTDKPVTLSLPSDGSDSLKIRTSGQLRSLPGYHAASFRRWLSSLCSRDS